VVSSGGRPISKEHAGEMVMLFASMGTLGGVMMALFFPAINSKICIVGGVLGSIILLTMEQTL
jgi:lipid-A-disaccharide synthase-like uncharacterized protein